MTLRACRFPDCFCGGPDECGTDAMNAPPPRPVEQFHFPDGFHEPKRTPTRNCICHFRKPECDCPPIGADHHSDCRCTICVGEARGGMTLVVIFLVMFWGAFAWLIWSWLHPPKIDANGNPAVIQLDPNPETCFEYPYRVRKTICDPSKGNSP